jgi:hypothetical protein
MFWVVELRCGGNEYQLIGSFIEHTSSRAEQKIMTILNASELAHFAAVAAFVGLAITLVAIRFAPIHRRAITDRRQSRTTAAIAAAPRDQGPVSEELTAPRRSAFRILWS